MMAIFIYSLLAFLIFLENKFIFAQNHNYGANKTVCRAT
jgi:hypothetical protein